MIYYHVQWQCKEVTALQCAPIFYKFLPNFSQSSLMNKSMQHFTVKHFSIFLNHSLLTIYWMTEFDQSRLTFCSQFSWMNTTLKSPFQLQPNQASKTAFKNKRMKQEKVKLFTLELFYLCNCFNWNCFW